MRVAKVAELKFGAVKVGKFKLCPDKLLALNFKHFPDKVELFKLLPDLE